MQIGTLAKRAGVTSSRIRFYEAEGLLPPPTRSESGYRDYDERALQTLLFVNRARVLGFSLGEIAAYLHSPADESRKARLLLKIEAKVTELDALSSDIKSRRAILMGLIEEVRATIPAH